MKLNWFSPLPPAHSAIATYAAAVLPALRRNAEVTVWSDAVTPSFIAPAERGRQRGGAEQERADSVAVCSYRAQAPPWEEINRAEVSLYHIGNHALFHAGICELSRQHPGIVVLHDARLQELAVAWAQLRGDWAAYVEAMGRYHGASGVAAAEDVWRGRVTPSELVETFPLTAAFVDRALGVVVHSEDARQLVEAAGAGPTLCLALPYRALCAAIPAREWCAPFRLIMFGFLGGNRGIDTILAALAAVPERDSFHLDIYGDLPEADRWRERIRAAGLGEHVTVHGYVTDAALAYALDRAHLVLNLRHPARGEASFSLLQAWDHGLPAVVSNTGWFGELPASCVAVAHHERAQDDLIGHLQRLRRDPDAYRRIGAAGRERLLQYHAPEPYAESLQRFALQVVHQRGRSNALLMADRAVAALRDVAGRHAGEWVLERVASAVHALTARRRPH